MRRVELMPSLPPRSMKLTLRTLAEPERDEERGQGGQSKFVMPVSQPSRVAEAFRIVEGGMPEGHTMYVVFVSSHEDGIRWCPHCRAAERVIAKQVLGWPETAPAQPGLVIAEAAVLQDEWRDELRPHPFSTNKRFGVRSLPVIIHWRNGRTGERLPYPANADPTQLRDFLMRTSSLLIGSQPVPTKASSASTLGDACSGRLSSSCRPSCNDPLGAAQAPAAALLAANSRAAASAQGIAPRAAQLSLERGGGDGSDEGVRPPSGPLAPIAASVSSLTASKSCRQSLGDTGTAASPRGRAGASVHRLSAADSVAEDSQGEREGLGGGSGRSSGGGACGACDSGAGVQAPAEQTRV